MATSIPNEKPGNLVVVGIPTKNGLWSYRFALSMWNLQTPINTSATQLVVIGKPVDDARNEIVRMAKQSGAKYLLFVDDDTLIPPFALLRLLNLMSGDARGKVKVASGVYYTKCQPPTPVILKKDVVGGFDKWNYGDVIKVDYIGLGCCLIDMSLFDEIEPPYFKYQKGSADPTKPMNHIGEDVYFCQKAQAAGYDIVVDTIIQCGHEDFASGTIYMFHEPCRCGAWQSKEGFVNWIPNGVQTFDETKPEINKMINAVSGKKLCWGYGDHDDFTEAGTVNVEELRAKFKDAKEAKIKAVLEYRTPEETLSFLHAVCLVCERGAPIEIKAPDVIPKIRALSNESDSVFIDKLTGCANGRYKTFYTAEHLNTIANILGLKNIKVSSNGEELVLNAENN